MFPAALIVYLCAVFECELLEADERYSRLVNGEWTERDVSSTLADLTRVLRRDAAWRDEAAAARCRF